MSTETGNDTTRGDTYVGFNMQDPEYKRQLKIEAAKRDYSSMAAFVRDVMFEELDIDPDSGSDA